MRDLLEPPFAVDWHPVASVLCLAPEVHLEPLKETLRRKELVRTPLIMDLVLRLNPESPLALEMKPAMDDYFAAGGTPEAFM